MKWGQVRVQTLALGTTGDNKPTKVTVTVAGQPVPATLALAGTRGEIKLANGVTVKAGERVELELG